MMKVVCILLVSLIPQVSYLEAMESLNADQAFKKLKSLQGIWKKENDKNGDFEITFELTANKSVLIESWMYKGKTHSLTLYHRNAEELMATHYCPQGNQPRLVMIPNSSESSISFRYFDATNLKSLDDSHQHSLGFEFSGLPQNLQRIESYMSNSGEKSSELRLKRKK